MNKPSYWRNSEYWICPNHIPPIRLPAVAVECWYSNCSTVRPCIESSEVLKITGKPNLTLLAKNPCSWKDCNKRNGTPEEQRPNSKYCSVDCKNKNARWRYNMKKKGLLV